MKLSENTQDIIIGIIGFGLGVMFGLFINSIL
jgi:hypothetical protein